MMAASVYTVREREKRRKINIYIYREREIYIYREREEESHVVEYDGSFCDENERSLNGERGIQKKKKKGVT